MAKVVFRNQGRTVEAERGSSLLEAALKNGVPIYHTCGGNCSCSTCRVVVLKGAEHLSKMEAAEAEILDAFDLKPPYRLGCQSLLAGDGPVEVDIPERDKAPRPNKTPPLPE